MIATAEAPRPRPGDPPITPELVDDHGLSPEEYEQILRIMGREPTFAELGVFSAMWSEHCGYKNSKRLLRLLPTRAPWVIQGPGENAGVIDVGAGYALAFKIESHNHPSAVEPYQGAATGIGGILRDVFTMGARPVATLNSLHFGDLDRPRVRYLFSGVVKGIGDYGNCVGIPSTGGEVYFDRGYEDNPIVNAMCLGLMRKEDLIRGTAEGVGNTLMAVGARTGRDGIHGATFASEELSEGDDEASRPQVQVGDPFTEKLLLEASLELIASGHIVGIQDMGAAGLTSSGAEMAGRSGTGVEMDVARVPVREEGMTPYEILLSESQERMLVVAAAGREDAVREILEKWELEAATIGTVTASGTFRVLQDGVPVADIPALPLTEGCPTYERPGEEAEEVRDVREMDVSHYISPPNGLESAFLAVVGSPNVASKQWVYEQYDTTVRANSIERPGGDAGVIRVPGTNRGVAASTDCNGRHTYLNPRSGAMGAVAEAARNVTCTGAAPMAITNCLNFGSPLKPHIRHQFREAVLGMRDACSHFETPVTGGNVSFYNETDGEAVYPTPVIGMIGVIEDLDTIVRHSFRDARDAILLLGTNRGELGGSEYLYAVHDGLVAGEPPGVDLAAERALQRCLLAMTGRKVLKSAHDVASGGLAATLVESCLGRPRKGDGVGAAVRLDDDLPDTALLFGEDHGRVVVSCAPEEEDRVRQLAADYGVPCTRIGTVTGEDAALEIATHSSTLTLALDVLNDHYFGTIPGIMSE
ncbi:MAG: phosphoribosylformylglycinamidine synthase subunit PurL [Gemmatimonadota bacterium]|nr:phosphoribosylformylglycinamidine synthase subunit PurL [Gemmatimonadota bacterium]